MFQLTIDGGEEALTVEGLQRGAGTMAVLTAVRERGCIGPADAGRLLHERRTFSCRDPLLPGARACCTQATSHGLRTLRRLVYRGLVERSSRGCYVMAQP